MQGTESLRNELLTEVESISPILAERAASTEILGRLAEASIDAVRTTRLLRMFSEGRQGMARRFER